MGSFDLWRFGVNGSKTSGLFGRSEMRLSWGIESFTALMLNDYNGC